MDILSGIAPDRVRQQLEKITASARFREAPGLVRLLQFVVLRELEGRGAEIKESTIAIEVFGRAESFDGRLDNLVRVNASRLRTKLSAYYAEEGRDDSVVVEIPRGSYVPRFISAAEAVSEAGSGPAVRPLPGRSFSGLAVVLSLVLLAIAASVLSYQAGARAAAPSVSPAVRAFYSRLWSRPVVLVYRVPVFLRMEPKYPAILLYEGHVTGMTYETLPLPSDVDPEARKQLGERPVQFENTWTDVGAAHGIFGIAGIFGRAGADLSIEDTLGGTAAQFRDKNLIVVSTPWYNSLFGQLPPLRFFRFDRGLPMILGRKSAAGAQEEYRSVRDPATSAMRSTYGFVSLGTGIWPGTRVLRISGLDPIGVQGAARFVTSEAGLEELARRLGGAVPDEFEAVLAVNCLKGQVSSVTVASVWNGR